MFLIPGVVIAIITFPGVMFHELSHQLACLLVGVKVEKVCYFRFTNPCGYVIHEIPIYFYQSLVISLAPIILGYGMTAVLAIMAQGNVIVLWVAFSMAMHALSSEGDIGNLWNSLRGYKSSMVIDGLEIVVPFTKPTPIAYRIVFFPICLVVMILNALRPLWVDAIIAILIIASLVG